MVRCLLALLVAAAVTSAPTWNDPRFISVRDGINNNPASTWKAAIHSNIPYDNQEALRRLCGSIMDATLLRQKAINQQPLGSESTTPSADQSGRRLQSSTQAFDLRTAYPQCAGLIGTVQNQANCGSCWAVSGASALSDQLCIRAVQQGNPNPPQKPISSQDAVECGTVATSGTGPFRGCQGGYIQGLFSFAQTMGIVSGAQYGNFTGGCKPYGFSPYGAVGTAVAPACNPSCANAALFRTPYYNDKTYIQGYTSLAGANVAATVANMENALKSGKPIVIGIDVYIDFYYYQTGVYQRSGYQGSIYVGGHAMVAIGFGTSNGVAYWIVVNSWGTGWGQGGIILIKKGSNECRIETFPVVANL